MKEITREKLEQELASILDSNDLIKSAASMVGFDLDGETDKFLSSADQRVRVNIHQRGRINTLQSLLEDEEA